MINDIRKGAAALIAVLVIASAGLILAAGAIFLGLNSLSISVDRATGSKAFALAEGCFHLGLRNLQLDQAYLGESLSLSDNSCIIKVSPYNGHYKLKAAASVESYVRAVESEVLIDGGKASVFNFAYPEDF